MRRGIWVQSNPWNFILCFVGCSLLGLELSQAACSLFFPPPRSFISHVKGRDAAPRFVLPRRLSLAGERSSPELGSFSGTMPAARRRDVVWARTREAGPGTARLPCPAPPAAPGPARGAGEGRWCAYSSPAASPSIRCVWTQFGAVSPLLVG